MDPAMYLKVFVDTDNDELLNAYSSHISKHNDKLINDAPYEDSGFDIFIPSATTFNGNSVTKVNLEIKCSAFFNERPCGFYVYPRSSISKTPLRLANQTGIIDAGYRGCLIGAFDNIKEAEYHAEGNTRLLQICGPFLQPIRVELVYSEDELGTTNRGTGGFGSTGDIGSFLSSTNNNVSGYMDIARQMEHLLNMNYMNNNESENNMNILDEHADIEIHDPDDDMVIEPVD
jgi:dUTP pyrophosphatase